MENNIGQGLSQQDIVNNFMNKPMKTTQKSENNEPKKLDDINNVVVLPNGYKLTIYPSKLKYFKSGDFHCCRLIKTLGLIPLITTYADGYDVLGRFLSAVFDKPYEQEQIKQDDDKFESKLVFNPYITNLIDNDLSPVDIENIIDISLKVSHIDEASFFQPLPNLTD